MVPHPDSEPIPRASAPEGESGLFHGIIHQDALGNILSANSAAERILGLSLGEMVRYAADPALWKILREDGGGFPLEEHPTRVALATGAPVEDATVGAVHPVTGEVRWLSVSAVPVFEPGEDRPRAVVTSFMNVSRRKAAEDALRERESLLRESQRAARVGSYAMDFATDKWVTSGALDAIHGIGPDFPRTGASWSLLAHPDDREDLLRFVREHRAGGERTFKLEYRIVRQDDGQVRWVKGQGKFLFDAEGRAQGVLGTVQDITDRKRAEEALLASERKFRTIFEALAEGVVLHEVVRDASGEPVDLRILEANPAFGRLLRMDPAQVRGRLATEVYGPAADVVLARDLKVAMGAGPDQTDVHFAPLDRHFRVSLASPRLGQSVTVFEDITDWVRREEALRQKNEEMERFTCMVSHDLQSPLVTIRTFLGYMEQDLASGRLDRAGQDMGFIRDASGRMGRLLEDLLEVSRVGRVVNPPVEVALADLVAGAVAATAGALRERGVEVQVEGPPLALRGDRRRMEEVWQNLLENAVKFMGGQPAPRIGCGVEFEGGEAVFHVRDNGTGIEPRFQSRIFGLFEQLDPATEGTGLGLALAKRIVELFGGRIWVESEGAGRGCRFRFTLPLARVEPGSAP